MHPLAILLVGMVVILGAIILLRVNAFLALIGAAILVSPLHQAIRPTRSRAWPKRSVAPLATSAS